MIDIIEERFTTPNSYPDDAAAMKARNARAKELRKQGYKVECKTWHFEDLARGSSYTLKARKERP